MPYLGIRHHNELNAYNLADDLIEPFRPIVDYFVFNLKNEMGNIIDFSTKKKLFSIVNLEIISGTEKHSLAYGIERFVDSVISFYEGKNKLLFPKIYGLGQHLYE